MNFKTKIHDDDEKKHVLDDTLSITWEGQNSPLSSNTSNDDKNTWRKQNEI